MPNQQKHRGQHSQDAVLFSQDWMPILRKSVADLSLLWTMGYPEEASLKLVGDHYRLRKRQRQALMRASCSNQAFLHRQRYELDEAFLKHSPVCIDAYNLLITTESILSGGIIMACRDGCYRDIASVHGTYRRVEETLPAIHLIGACLQDLGVESVYWYLDAPISNSGRLKNMLLQEAHQHGWPWEAALVPSPDKVLAETEGVVISSDSWILDQALGWYNLCAFLLRSDRLPKSANLKRMC